MWNGTNVSESADDRVSRDYANRDAYVEKVLTVCGVALFLTFLLIGDAFLLIRLRLQSSKVDVRLTQMRLDLKGFLTYFDVDVISSLYRSINTPLQLLEVNIPSVLSVLVAPVVEVLYGPLWKNVWPNEKEIPNINDALVCYLMPAGLIYALSFSTVITLATEKNKATSQMFLSELTTIDSLLSVIGQLNLSNVSKVKCMRAVKSQIISLALDAQSKKPGDFKRSDLDHVRNHVWIVVDEVKSKLTGELTPVDECLLDHTVTWITQLNCRAPQNVLSHKKKMHPFKWCFPLALGALSYLGVIFVNVHSTLLSMLIRLITILSISVLCYVISDYDNPFTGFFSLDASLLETMLVRAYDAVAVEASSAGRKGSSEPPVNDISSIVSIPKIVIEKWVPRRSAHNEVSSIESAGTEARGSVSWGGVYQLLQKKKWKRRDGRESFHLELPERKADITQWWRGKVVTWFSTLFRST